MATRMKKDDVLAWIHGFEAAREVERDLARKEPIDSAGSMVASRPQDLRDVEELLLRYVDTVDLPRSRRLVGELERCACPMRYSAR
jgi:hypothetical protein